MWAPSVMDVPFAELGNDKIIVLVDEDKASRETFHQMLIVVGFKGHIESFASPIGAFNFILSFTSTVLQFKRTVDLVITQHSMKESNSSAQQSQLAVLNGIGLAKQIYSFVDSNSKMASNGCRIRRPVFITQTPSRPTRDF